MLRRRGGAGFLIIGCLFPLLTVFYTMPLVGLADRWSPAADWDFRTPQQISPWLTTTQFAQFPLWSPFVCGGYYEFGHPYATILSPGVIADLLFGPVRGYKLKIAAYCYLGLVGTFLLARRLGAARIPAIAAALVYMLSGAYAEPLARASYDQLAMGWVPYVFLFFLAMPRRGCNYRTALAGFCHALLLYEGAPYLYAFVSLALTLLMAGSLLRRRHDGWYLQTGYLWFALFALGFAAPRLVPILHFLQYYPRAAAAVSNQFPLALLLQRWLCYRSTETFLWMQPLFDEHLEMYLYMGVAPLLLTLPALLRARRRWLCLTLAAAGLLVFLGSSHTLLGIGWRILNWFPPFSSLRGSFRIVFLLCLGCGLGTALTLTRLSCRPWGQWLAACAVLALGTDLMLVNRPLWQRGFSLPPLCSGQPVFCPPFRQHDGENRNARVFPLIWAGQGNTTLFNDIALPRRAQPAEAPEYRGEWYAPDPRNRIAAAEFSPQVLRFTVDFTVPGILVVNQNYFPGWQTTVGTVRAAQGLLAVELPAGRHAVVLTFMPWSAVAGLVLFLMTVGLAVVARRRRQPTALRVRLTPLLPCALLCVLLGTVAADPVWRERAGSIIRHPRLPLVPYSWAAHALPEEVPDTGKKRLAVIELAGETVPGVVDTLLARLTAAPPPQPVVVAVNTLLAAPPAAGFRGWVLGTAGSLSWPPAVAEQARVQGYDGTEGQWLQQYHAAKYLGACSDWDILLWRCASVDGRMAAERDRLVRELSDTWQRFPATRVVLVIPADGTWRVQETGTGRERRLTGIPAVMSLLQPR